MPTPVLDMRLFGESRVFLFSNLAALINYSATFAVTFLLSLDLQYTKGFTPEHAGLILIAQAFMMMIVSPVAGRLSDRIEPRVVASIGMGCTALGLGLFSLFLTESTTALVHPLGPDAARCRCRALLLAEHQRDHERRRQSVSTGWHPE